MKDPFKLTRRTKLSNVIDYNDPARSGNYFGYGEYADAKNGMHLRDYWRSVRRYQWMILSLAVVTALAVAIYMSRQPDIFEARARVQVDLENTIPALAGSKNGPSLIANTVNDPTYFSTQLQVLSSSSLLRRVVKTLDLEHDKAFSGKQSSTLDKGFFQKLKSKFSFDNKPRTQTEQKVTTEDSKVEVVPLVNSTPGLSKSVDATDATPEDMEEVRRLAP
ncbi:MAG TPA: Wzz/FepE/Etk N-terminal domain-containing protein, partial [Blastocatellia bacterium]|nr:Wzz/FepE/Etk N-terminal domain-containing protein [Blastocatellia bacterium]